MSTSIKITSFHAHVYYDAASREAAERVRQGLGDRFEVQLGRWHLNLAHSPVQFSVKLLDNLTFSLEYTH